MLFAKGQEFLQRSRPSLKAIREQRMSEPTNVIASDPHGHFTIVSPPASLRGAAHLMEGEDEVPRAVHRQREPSISYAISPGQELPG